MKAVKAFFLVVSAVLGFAFNAFAWDPAAKPDEAGGTSCGGGWYYGCKDATQAEIARLKDQLAKERREREWAERDRDAAEAQQYQMQMDLWEREHHWGGR